MNRRLLLLGEIVKPWGYKGELKVNPYADLTLILPGREGLLLQRGDQVRCFSLERFRIHCSVLILKFKELEDYEGASRFQGWQVGIPRETAPSLPPHTYYHYDIIGLKVISDGQFMGRIKEILSTGANDVYMVEREGQEWLLPAVKEVIERVDLERGILYTTPIEGLIDLEAV